MSFTRCSRIAVILVAWSLSLSAQTSPQQTADPSPPSHGTLPQIVRLSLAEGDVRIARGKHDEKLTGNVWEQAITGIPLQSGFSLATGPDGRAEIEFEDASTLYLAPNSALTLADLTTKDSVPHTALTLLSGTITTHLDPTVPHEEYVIQTATQTLKLAYGVHSYVRVTSYLDALQITPKSTQTLVTNGVGIIGTRDESYDVIGTHIIPVRADSTPATLAWDTWVADRIHTRAAAMQSVMHEAGLSSPIPGLADLAGKGTFTPCAPYGTCWEPANGWTHQSSDTTPTNSLPGAQPYTVSVSQLGPTAPQTTATPRVTRAPL